VWNGESNTVFLLDVDDSSVASITVEGEDTTQQFCFSEDKVLAVSRGDSKVSIIDLANDNQLSTVTVGELPSDVCIAGNKAFVTNQGDDNVSIIDLADNTVTPVEVGDMPMEIYSVGNDIVLNADKSISILI
jgi:YVTN family beta-propeller protein